MMRPLPLLVMLALAGCSSPGPAPIDWGPTDWGDEDAAWRANAAPGFDDHHPINCGISSRHQGETKPDDENWWDLTITEGKDDLVRFLHTGDGSNTNLSLAFEVDEYRPEEPTSEYPAAILIDVREGDGAELKGYTTGGSWIEARIGFPETGNFSVLGFGVMEGYETETCHGLLFYHVEAATGDQ